MTFKFRQKENGFEFIIFILFLLTLPFLNPWVRGDGVGYYAYARAPLIQHDLNFTRDYQWANESFREGRLDENGLPKEEFRTRTGHLDNHFTVGPAILWAPFLILAHCFVMIARALGSQVAPNGFSGPYRYAMAFGTASYGFLALLLSFRLARKYVGILWSFVATIAVWWASSLPVYMYFNPSWSHAHSAFTVALFIWYWDSTRDERTLSQWILLGLIVGLMLNVYYANLMIVTVVVIEGAYQYARYLSDGPGAAGKCWKLLSDQCVFGLVVVIVMIPTFVSRWIVYGGPFETGYLSIRDFLWKSPAFWSVLFSSNHGLISWTPLLGLAFLGLLLLAVRSPRVGVHFFAAAIMFYLFISFYPDWAGVASFGNRFFISLTSLFILGLGYLLRMIAKQSRNRRTTLFASAVVLTCFAIWNLGLIYQWGTHLIPARGPVSFRQATFNQFHVVPTRIASSLKLYFLRRSELMNRIEQHDVDQSNKSAQP